MTKLSDKMLEQLWYLQRDIDRFFRELLNDYSGGGERSRTLDVPADIYEDGDELFICLDLAGVERSGLELYVQRDLIVVEGTKQQASLESDARFYHQERVCGEFRRLIELPAAVDTRRIKAVFQHGVLTIRLPRIKERRGERRRVNVE